MSTCRFYRPAIHNRSICGGEWIFFAHISFWVVWIVRYAIHVSKH